MADQDNQGQFGNRPDTQQQAQKGGQMSSQQNQRSSDTGMNDTQLEQDSEEDMQI